MGTAFVKIIKEKMPVNSPAEALPVFCVILVSLISVAASRHCAVYFTVPGTADPTSLPSG